MKKINKQFIWYAGMAVVSGILACCYAAKHEDILSICWAIIAGCDLGIAWFNKGDKE